jgi:cell division protein FtsQ
MKSRKSTAKPAASQVLRWVLGGLLVSLLLAGTVAAAVWLQAPGNVPLERVRIEGDVRHTRESQLKQALATALHGSFFSIDLEAVRRAVEALPWVSQAGVRRVWPPALVLTVSEMSALARWGDDALVSPEGRVFRPQADSLPDGLPRLRGPAGSAPEMVSRYRDLSERLKPLGLGIEALAMNERHALNLTLGGGPVLLLGNREPEQRLGRFLAHWAALRDSGIAEQVDLRYAHGFSVRWSGQVAGANEVTGAEG